MAKERIVNNILIYHCYYYTPKIVLAIYFLWLIFVHIQLLTSLSNQSDALKDNIRFLNFHQRNGTVFTTISYCVMKISLCIYVHKSIQYPTKS